MGVAVAAIGAAACISHRRLFAAAGVVTGVDFCEKHLQLTMSINAF